MSTKMEDAKKAKAKIAAFREEQGENLKVIKAKIKGSRPNAELEIIYLPPVDACAVLVTPESPSIALYFKQLPEEGMLLEASKNFVVDGIVYPNFETANKWMNDFPMMATGIANKLSAMAGRLEELEGEKL